MILNERERKAAYELYAGLAAVLQTHQIIMEEAKCEYGIPSAVEKALMALQEDVIHYEALITGELPVQAQDWQTILEGSFLVDLRISRGWTQADLANSLQISVQQLQTWERTGFSRFQEKTSWAR